jgi:hypothetical protein
MNRTSAILGATCLALALALGVAIGVIAGDSGPPPAQPAVISGPTATPTATSAPAPPASPTPTAAPVTPEATPIPPTSPPEPTAMPVPRVAQQTAPPPTLTPTATATPDMPLLTVDQALNIGAGYVLPDGRTVRSCLCLGIECQSASDRYYFVAGSRLYATYKSQGDWEIVGNATVVDLELRGKFLFVRLLYNERTRQFLTLDIPPDCQKP